MNPHPLAWPMKPEGRQCSSYLKNLLPLDPKIFHRGATMFPTEWDVVMHPISWGTVLNPLGAVFRWIGLRSEVLCPLDDARTHCQGLPPCCCWNMPTSLSPIFEDVFFLLPHWWWVTAVLSAWCSQTTAQRKKPGKGQVGQRNDGVFTFCKIELKIFSYRVDSKTIKPLDTFLWLYMLDISNLLVVNFAIRIISTLFMQVSPYLDT